MADDSNLIDDVDKRKSNEVVTVAISGSHCAGKATLGKRVAQRLGWQFDQELGDVLRDDWRREGHNFDTNDDDDQAKFSWDRFVWEAEIKRDRSNRNCNRIVETWHFGNLGWAMMRNAPMLDRVKQAVTEQGNMKFGGDDGDGLVVLIHLQVSWETMLRRRRIDERNIHRLPMEHETEQCKKVHEFLNDRVLCEVQSEWVQNLNIPLLVLENDVDGEEALETNVQHIVDFISTNRKRHLGSSSLGQNHTKGA